MIANGALYGNEATVSRKAEELVSEKKLGSMVIDVVNGKPLLPNSGLLVLIRT